MFDLVVRNGRVVDAGGVRVRSLGVSDGHIAAAAEPGEDLAGRTEIDAGGKLVLPGFVDAHVHLREPGLTHKEDFASGTRAAAAGGVTTLMVMPTDDPWTASGAEFERKRELARNRSYVDFALQAAVGPGAGAVEIEELARLGAISFEIFLAGGRPEFLVEDDADLLRILLSIRAVDGVAGVTPGSPGIIAAATAEHRRVVPGTLRAFAASRPPISEAVGIAKVLALAAETGARIHLRQVSCAQSVDILKRFVDHDRISSEVTPHNLVLTEEDAQRLGCLGTVIPPLRSKTDVQALQNAARAGVIDMVATDHAPHLIEEKEQGRTDIWKAPPGFPGLQTWCLMMLDLADRKVLAIEDLARLCAAEPARRFGLFPRKGSLTPGADADIIVVDPEAFTEIRNEDQYSKAGFTPFAGRRVRGRIDCVLLRGRIVARGGRTIGDPGGRFLRACSGRSAA